MGTVVCWGDDEEGQCHLPPEHQTAVAVSCGGYRIALLLQDGRLAIFAQYDCGTLHIATVTQKSPQLRSVGEVIPSVSAMCLQT
jgi:hypothetical protein